MPAHGMLVLAAGLLLAAEPTRKPAEPVERKTTQYTVELVVVQADAQGRDFGPDGRGKFLAEPRLVMQEGRSASFLAGGQAELPGAEGATNFVPIGIQLNLKITAEPGNRLRLVASLGQSNIESSDADQLTIASKSVQTASAVELGDAVKLTLKDDRGETTHWAKVRVVEKEETAVKQYRARGAGK